jgi:hypothetical protein
MQRGMSGWADEQRGRNDYVALVRLVIVYRVRLLAAPCLCLGLLAACGSVVEAGRAPTRPGSATGSSRPVGQTPTPPRPVANTSAGKQVAATERAAPCSTDQLHFEFESEAGAMGTDGGRLIAYKRGTRPCVLSGYPRIIVVDRAGDEGRAARRIRPGQRLSMILGPGPRSTRVKLSSPGSTAVAWMSWGSVPYPGVECVPNASLEIEPPNSRGQSTIHPRLFICGNPVVEPFRGPRFLPTP